MYNIILSDNDLASHIVHSMNIKRPLKYKGKLPLLSYGDQIPDRLRGSVAERMARIPRITEGGLQRDLQGYGDEVEMPTQPTTKFIGEGASIFNEIDAGLRPGRILSNRGARTAAIYEGENGPLYIELNGNIHNIITNGEWTYPILVDIIPYIKADGKPSTNIIICKKSVAKNLVYFKLNKFTNTFDFDILNKSKFHLLDHHNAYSYANAATGKFSRENEILGNNVHVDRNESASSYENLRIRFRNSKHPSIAVSIKKSVIREGKIFCWLSYSFISLQEAKNLVYWNKNAVKMRNSKKMINSRGTATGRSSSHSTGWTYNRAITRLTNKRPVAELVVERVDDPVNRATPELPQPDVNRHYVNTQAEVRSTRYANISIAPAVQREREHVNRMGRETRAEEINYNDLPWNENPNITTRRPLEEVRAQEESIIEVERHTTPQWDALIQERNVKKSKRLFQTKRDTIEEERQDREERRALDDRLIITKHNTPQWGGLVNDVKVENHGAEIHTAPEWGAVVNAAREMDLQKVVMDETSYGSTTINGPDILEEDDEGVEEEVKVQSGHLEEHLARALGRTRAAPAPNIEEDQNVEEEGVKIRSGHFEIRALGRTKAAPALDVAEDQDVERGRDVEDGQDREGYYE